MTLNLGEPARPAWVKPFLEALAAGTSINGAVAAAGVSKQTAYKLRRGDADFGRDWDEALARGKGGGDGKASSRRAFEAILADPSASARAKIDAGEALRKLDRNWGKAPKASAPAGPSEAVRATLREAAISAHVSMLTFAALMPRLRTSYDAWQAVADLDEGELRAVLAEAENPQPLTGADGRIMSRPLPAPRAVVEALRAVVAGEPVDGVLRRLQEAAAERQALEQAAQQQVRGQAADVIDLDKPE